MRHGLDAAIAIRLGADMVAAAGPMLAHLVADDAALDLSKLQDFVSGWKQQMALTLFLTGAPDLAAFRQAEICCDGAVIAR